MSVQISCPFYYWVFLSFESDSCILDARALSDMGLCWFFLPFCCLSFHSLYSVFREKWCFLFWWSPVYHVDLFLNCAFGFILRNLCLTRDFRGFSSISTKCLMVSGSTLGVWSHLESHFAYCVRYGSKFIYFLRGAIQVFRHHVLRLPYELLLHFYENSVVHIYVSLFLDSLICSIHLFACLDANTTVHCFDGKSQCQLMLVLQLFLLVQSCFGSSRYFAIHTSFRVSLPIAIAFGGYYIDSMDQFWKNWYLKDIEPFKLWA